MEAGVDCEADAGGLCGVSAFLFVLSAKIATLHRHRESVKPAMLDAKEEGDTVLTDATTLLLTGHCVCTRAVCQHHDAASHAAFSACIASSRSLMMGQYLPMSGHDSNTQH